VDDSVGRARFVPVGAPLLLEAIKNVVRDRLTGPPCVDHFACAVVDRDAEERRLVLDMQLGREGAWAENGRLVADARVQPVRGATRTAESESALPLLLKSSVICK
jgi:hypothetical protein